MDNGAQFDDPLTGVRMATLVPVRSICAHDQSSAVSVGHR